MGPFRSGNKVAVLAMALVVTVATSSVVSGQTGTALRISPPNFEIQADPGQTVAQQIKVSNRGTEPLPVTMQLAAFQPSGQGGGVVLEENEQSKFGVVSWTTVTPKEMLLQPGEERAVAFLIEIPPNAPPGGHYMSILAAIGSGATTAQGVAVGQRVGSLVLLKVAGEIVEQARVAEFSAPALAAKGPIDFQVVVKNTGNVHVRPAGVITIKGTFGGETAKLSLEQNNVLPESQREFKATWDTGWRMGRYTAEYLGIYGTKNVTMQGSTSVIIFPWPIALPVLAVVGLLALLIIRGRKRLARSFKVLAGRE